jgi:hypothetical protein
MPESGGTTTQSGILYQNSIAALYLGRLVDERARPLDERPVEVRVEAPEQVDDVVVRFEDGHREFIQAKESVSSSSDAWRKLWHDFEEQKTRPDFGTNDRLVLWLGQNTPQLMHLREACQRTRGYSNFTAWSAHLSQDQRPQIESIRPLLADEADDALFALLSRVDVEITTLDQIERDYAPAWMPQCDSPIGLFRALVHICGDNARYRQEMTPDRLRGRLHKDRIPYAWPASALERARAMLLAVPPARRALAAVMAGVVLLIAGGAIILVQALRTPSFGVISVCLPAEVDRAARRCTTSHTTFTGMIDRVSISWPQRNISKGLRFRRVWYLNGEQDKEASSEYDGTKFNPAASSEYTWYDYGAEHPDAPDAFPAGAWAVELYIGDRLEQTARFSILR